ncbi:class I SAM-dependent methyltransferase [Roseomonas elaeocarpi]|uniref:Methyltransferase domain-containing protein n=1 Tax=Roseomonas elaeocarpi TaxID=907779 RepID=A0ABV6JX68_9PROT
MPDLLPRRANLGCGWDIRPGFLNIDLHGFHKPDLVGDITDLPQLPSGHFEALVAQDVLEHLERGKVPGAIAEWSRLLAPGGVIELRMPSLLHLMAMLASPEWRTPEKAAEVTHLMFGSQAYNGDYHLSGYTPALLVKLLGDAGLLVCEARVRDGWLFELRARKAAALTVPEEVVGQCYFEELHRPADAAGLAGFAAAMRDGMTEAALRNALRGSDEAEFLRHNPSFLVPYRGQTIGA